MQEKMQRGNDIYYEYFSSGLPLQNDLGSEEKSLGMHYSTQRFLPEPYYSELLEIKEQITAVNFRSELDGVIGELVFNNTMSDTVPRDAVSKAYEKMKRMMGE